MNPIYLAKLKAEFAAIAEDDDAVNARIEEAIDAGSCDLLARIAFGLEAAGDEEEEDGERWDGQALAA